LDSIGFDDGGGGGMYDKEPEIKKEQRARKV